VAPAVTTTPLAFAAPEAPAPAAAVEPAVEPSPVQAAEASETPDEQRDDSSYPPVEFDHAFFSPSSPADDPLGEPEMRDPRLALKASPAAAQRRAQLAKYVKGAVAVASALCLVALVKAGMAQKQARAAAASPQLAAQVDPPAARAQMAAAAVVPPAAPAATVAPAANPAAATAATVAAAADPPAAPDTASAPPAPAAPAADTAAPAATGATAAATAPTPDPKEAAKEKATSRRALERGNMRQAIEAGELSVTLDPTDGEAWLILGAAYQQKGDMKDARRCYKACLEQGKRGPKAECAQMLR
jgi:tetratricopeptide (TPR) repeat protein